jgi:hypothetical protein
MEILKAMNEFEIIRHERRLRTWFICNADPVLAEIDGVDIGWGGVKH